MFSTCLSVGPCVGASGWRDSPTGSPSTSSYVLSLIVYGYIAVRSLICHTAKGIHMPYIITQCYLPPNRGDIPAFTPAEAGTRLSDPGGIQG